MMFKTYSGAAKRAAFERADAKHWGRPYTYRVVQNTNSHQIAQGYVWRVKKEKIKT
jgi:hypothetical protein